MGGTPTLVVEGPWAGNLRQNARLYPIDRYERVHLRCTNRDHPHGRMKELSADRMFGHAKEMLEASDAAGGGHRLEGSL